MLKERNTRVGFFEAEQLASVLAHLPAEIRPVIEFAHITGWRITSEVLPLEWRQVDFGAAEVRLDAHTTKNDEGRVFPITDRLRAVLKAQYDEHLTLKKTGRDRAVGVLQDDCGGTWWTEEAAADPRVQKGVGGRVSRCWLSRQDSARPATDGRAEPCACGHSRTRGHDE